MKKILALITVLLLLQAFSFGQAGVSRFLSSGAQDVEKLTELYLTPFGKGFGTAMNSGWYNTAKPHKLFGFDFTINSTFVTIPTQDASFDLGVYTWSILKPGEQTVSPTLAGTGGGATVGIDFGDGNSIDNLYDLPSGIDFRTVPLPMMQLGLGLIKGTDLTFRYFPEMEFSDLGKIGMLGFGLKHDFKQWIPVFNKLPFDLSIQGAWSRLSGTYNKVEYYPTDFLNVTFERVGTGLPINESQIANDYYRTQDLTLTTSAWNTNLIVSKEISVFTGFASIGYSSSNFNIALNGKYLMPEYIPVTDPDYLLSDDLDQNGIVTVLDGENEVVDPIDSDIEYASVNIAVGFRLKLSLFSLHAAYVYQNYSMFNVGLGVSFN